MSYSDEQGSKTRNSIIYLLVANDQLIKCVFGNRMAAYESHWRIRATTLLPQNRACKYGVKSVLVIEVNLHLEDNNQEGIPDEVNGAKLVI